MSEIYVVGIRGRRREKKNKHNRVGVYERVRGLECTGMRGTGQEQVERFLPWPPPRHSSLG